MIQQLTFLLFSISIVSRLCIRFCASENIYKESEETLFFWSLRIVKENNRP